MKHRHSAAALLLCAALLLSGCGQSAPEAGKSAGTAAENADTTEAARTDGAAEAAQPSDEAGEPAESGEPLPEEELEQQVPDYFEKLSSYIGTWYSETGDKRLVVKADGSFFLDGTEEQEGWLSWTEEDGEGLWESGPRFELYTEGGERIPETYLTLDEDHEGQIVYAVGGGAELFNFDGPAPEVQTRTVRAARVTEEMLPDLGDYDEFSTGYEGDYPVLLLYTAVEPVRDFRVLEVHFTDIDEAGNVYYDVLDLFAQDELTPECPLLVRTSFPGDMPTNGFSYIEEDGSIWYVAVGESGYDGSLVTEEFAAPDAVG